MGNYSRDPNARITHAVSKQYVAVRMQQAVPILDADWNLLDDIRRRDSEVLGARFLGDGVPTNSDGFRVFSSGQNNDFGIRAGLLIVGGKTIQLDADTSYTKQPLFKSTAVTPTVDPLTTPVGNVAFVAYLDTWEQEVDSQGDSELTDSRIGIETVVVIQRLWAVRVALLSDFGNIQAAPAAGHFIYALARIDRLGGNDTINDNMLTDLRDTDASPRREVAFRRGASTIVLVDTSKFLGTITSTRDNVNDFVVYLTTKFVDPTLPFTAVEVMGVESLRATATVAEQGVSLANSRVLDMRGALRIYGQLLNAEQRFLTVWQKFVLPLLKNGIKVYENAYFGMVQGIGTFVNGPAPAGFLTIADALGRANLLEAQRSQDQINSLIAGATNPTTGSLNITYLGSTALTVTANVSLDLRFRILGSITPDDDIGVEALIDPAWNPSLRNSDGSTPFALHMGPGNDSREILVRVTPSATVDPALLTLHVFANHNPGGLQQVSGQFSLKIGNAPPPSDDQFAFSITVTSLSQAGGNFQIVHSATGSMTFRLSNNTTTAATLAVTFSPTAQGDWVIKPPLGVNLGSLLVPAKGNVDLTFQFKGSATIGATLRSASPPRTRPIRPSRKRKLPSSRLESDPRGPDAPWRIPPRGGKRCFADTDTSRDRAAPLSYWRSCHSCRIPHPLGRRRSLAPGI